MLNFKRYWILQVFGWGGYVVVSFLLNQWLGIALNVTIIGVLLTVFFFGVATTHLVKKGIHNLGWKKKSVAFLVPRLLLLSIFLAVLLQITLSLIDSKAFKRLDLQEIVISILGFLTLYIIWFLIYFVHHFFTNFRKEEIKNLQWQAQKSELELNKIKSQLNPHFLFNSMNSIKALISESPDNAKKSITQLSRLLRTTLQIGEKNQISFNEELALIKDYLDLEKTRYEERLQVVYEIHPDCLELKIPPLLIQTLVENGIKHGISKLPEGGQVKVKANLNKQLFVIIISNDGRLANFDQKQNIGSGIENSKQRLELIYGSNAQLNVFEKDNRVEAQVKIDLRYV